MCVCDLRAAKMSLNEKSQKHTVFLAKRHGIKTKAMAAIAMGSAHCIIAQTF